MLPSIYSRHYYAGIPHRCACIKHSLQSGSPHGFCLSLNNQSLCIIDTMLHHVFPRSDHNAFHSETVTKRKWLVPRGLFTVCPATAIVYFHGSRWDDPGEPSFTKGKSLINKYLEFFPAAGLCICCCCWPRIVKRSLRGLICSFF